MTRVPCRMPNMGNTCYISSALQCLRATSVFVEACDSKSPVGRVMCYHQPSPQSLAVVYQWCRRALLLQNRKTPEDPAEMLVKLFDDDAQLGVSTICFESARTTCKKCRRCGHEKKERDTEKMLIVPFLPEGQNAVQRAVDSVFGFQSTEAPALKQQIMKPSLPLVAAKSNDLDAPPMTYYNYNRGFAGAQMTESASAARDRVESKSAYTRGEVWYRCDDNIITEVQLTSAQPYVLFYEERRTAVMPAGSPSQESNGTSRPVIQKLALDCDDGECKSKQEHDVYVSAYELSSALVVHVAVPKVVKDMNDVERTLIAGSDDGQRAYDLRAFVARVGANHYVAYVRKQNVIK